MRKIIFTLMLALCCMTVGAQSKMARKTVATKARTATPVASKGDLPMFDLHGTVKSTKMSTLFGMEDSTYEFDRNGRVIKCDGQKVTSFRDMVGDMWNFTKNNGKLTKIKTCGTACYEYVFTYNTNGEIIKYVEKVNSPFGNNTTTYSVTILERDSHGNWTKRKISGYGNTRTESRTISYY